MRAIPIGFGFRIYANRSNHPDCIGDIIGSKPPGQNNWRPDKLDDAPADPPVVGSSKRTDLAIRFTMTVQEQEISDPLVGLGNCDARLVHDGDASRQQHAGQLPL
jgi:hypothetical protein